MTQITHDGTNMTDKTRDELPSDGMPILQLISMLEAAVSQGAERVCIALRKPDGLGHATGVDWVSTEPVEGVVYLGCMPTWDDMSHKAMESLDW